MRTRLAAAFLVVPLLAPLTGRAQGIDMTKGGPVEVTSDNGMEWRQNEQVIIAKGNAKAVRGDVTVIADELIAHGDAWSFQPLASKLVGTKLLVLTSDDGNGPKDMALVAAVEGLGGHRVSAAHAATDHSWSDHRIALEALVVNWLAEFAGK